MVGVGASAAASVVCGGIGVTCQIAGGGVPAWLGGRPIGAPRVVGSLLAPGSVAGPTLVTMFGE